MMDKFPHSDGFRKRTKEERKQQCPDVEWCIDLLPEAHVCNALLKELDNLWEQKLPNSIASTESIMVERIGDYLKACSKTQLYNKVCFHPVYCNGTVSVSIEQYVNQKFMDQNEPSHIVIYECYDGTVNANVVNQYVGQYYQKAFIKVYICSTHSFDRKTQNVARSKNIGLMLINPMYEVTEENYIVPRSIEMYAVEQMKQDMLCGKRSMTTPFVLYDEQGVTFSLVDTLKYHGIKVNKDICFTAPYYSDEYIERKSLESIKKDVENFVYKMKNYHITHQVPTFEVDPKQLLMNEGYQLEEAEMSNTGQLAYIDMKEKKVVTDSALVNNILRLRYSYGHELGHAKLHSEINVAAFGESNSTLNANAFISSIEQKRLEHQANYFAACILMPSEVVGYLYSFYYQAHMGCNTIQPFYLEDTTYKLHDFMGIVCPMARKLKVSVEALKWRLVKLGLLKIS